MGKTPEMDVERLLRGSSFSDPAHKESLRSHLFDKAFELTPDDLDMVSGGASTDHFYLNDWNVPGTNKEGGLT